MTRGRKPRRRERAKLTMILLYSDCKWCLVYWVVVIQGPRLASISKWVGET